MVARLQDAAGDTNIYNKGHIGCVQIQALGPSKDPAFPVYVGQVLGRPRKKVAVNSDGLAFRFIPVLTPVYDLSPSHRDNDEQKQK